MTDNDDAKLVELRATAHPLRLRILSLLTGVALSATEVAAQLRITQANASYHLRLLERAELVTVVEEVSIRGGRAKRYRHLPAPTREHAAAGPVNPDVLAARAGMDRAVAAELVRRGALRAGGPATTTDAELWVSPADWQRAVDALVAVSVELHAAAVAPRSADAIRVNATVAAFVMSDEAPDEPS